MVDHIIISETTKVPLFKNGNIIGILGVILDITDRIKRESLELENQAYQIEQQQQQKFRKIVEQVVHDIGSPIGAITLMLPSFNAIPEQKRLALNNSVTRIRDVLNSLWNEFIFEENHNDNETDLSHILVYKELLDIINEKKYEFNQHAIEFTIQVSDMARFAFINLEAQEFKRVISNIINNSVDALESTICKKIAVYLNIVDDKVRIIIQDNGKGMPDAIKDKIMNNIRVTSGKINGHGVGFEYIRGILANNHGVLSIKSEQNVGTRIILNFPKVKNPNWLCTELIIKPNNTIVVLDDDDFIHEIWYIKLTTLLEEIPSIQFKYFKYGEDVINFVKTLSIEEKTKLLFLSDYELVNQKINGLDVIDQVKLDKDQVILVTNYINHDLQQKVKQLHIKFIPKSLINAIAIKVSDKQLDNLK